MSFSRYQRNGTISKISLSPTEEEQETGSVSGYKSAKFMEVAAVVWT